MRGSAQSGDRRDNAAHYIGKNSLWLQKDLAWVGGGPVLVQFLPAWTSHLSFASDLRVENVMLALKDCGEDQDRVLDWSSQQVIRNGACYCLIKNSCFFLIEV